MPREYRYIKEYETEILSLRKKGLTLKKFGEQLGFTHKQLEYFIICHNTNQRKKSVSISYKSKRQVAKGLRYIPSMTRSPS